MAAIDDYFSNDDGYWDSLGKPATTETTSAGSDWSGVFGKLLDTGATVAGSLFKTKADTNDKVLQKAIADANAQTGASTTVKVLYIVGGVVVLVLVGWLVFKKR